MMRLDKFLAEMKIGTRSEVKQLIKKKQVSVNGSVDLKPERKIDPQMDHILYQNRELHYEKNVYYMLNKPAGVVSATKDRVDRTVVDLLKGEPVNGLFPVGRLDKDTEGLLLLTDDGAFAHKALSPKKHVKKCYYAILDQPVTDTQILDFARGIDIKDEKITLPATLQTLSQEEQESYRSRIETKAYATLRGYDVLVWITEGRYHQIKRMFAVYGQEVLYLKRMSMGKLELYGELPTGSYCKLSVEEANKALEATE